MWRRRLIVVWVSLTALAWMTSAFWLKPFASAVSGWFGEALLRAGQGKFADVPRFVEGRLAEGLWLSAFATLLCLGLAAGDGLLARRNCGKTNRWVAGSLLGFIALNVWLLAAEQTIVGWGLLWQGKTTSVLAQFQVKRILLKENSAGSRAILLGSSQTRAQIDEEYLNQILAGKLWTTEFHYPGARAYDVLLISRKIERRRGDYLICYLSESYFYGGVDSDCLPFFFGFRDLPDWYHLGGAQFHWGRKPAYGLLGNVLPLFYCRDVLSQRLLGAELVGLRQGNYDASLAADLPSRAREIANSYRQDESSGFQKRAFERFLVECGRRDNRVILCAGQLNPILGEALAPSLRLDMMQFLRSMAAKYPYVRLLAGDTLPVQTKEAYLDLTHVDRDAQRKFTLHLGGVLERILSSESKP